MRECGGVQKHREGGAHVTTNVMLWDMDLAVPQACGGRRLEIVADDLPLLAVDTTFISPLHCDGSVVARLTLSERCC